MNEKQIEIAERVLINSANVFLASMILGNFWSAKEFNLWWFSIGCILFVSVVGIALWLRKEAGK